MRPDSAVGIGFVQKRPEGVVLLDARAPERYRGEKEPIDKIAGHIPGAKNRYCIDNLTAEGIFKEPRQLWDEFSAVLQSTPPSEVVNYCGSGVSACHNLLAMEVAGLTGAKLYPGSWSDWISDPKRPIATSEP
jgi:thiosulfate/3-mercaptopyruvate sulfurtransferase